MEGMLTMKPIQATPKLSGKDALNLLTHVNRKPTEYSFNIYLALRAR